MADSEISALKDKVAEIELLQKKLVELEAEAKTIKMDKTMAE